MKIEKTSSYDHHLELDTDNLNVCFQSCYVLGHCLAFHHGEVCILLLSDPFDEIKMLEEPKWINEIEKMRLT